MSESVTKERKSYEESYLTLRELGYLERMPDRPSFLVALSRRILGKSADPEQGESIPPIPERIPRPGDPEPHGISFFRTRVGPDDTQTGLENLGNLTLPRTFLGRSEISGVSFRNTDLSESSLCWNDFLDVDFTEAILARSDLRASIFKNVNFTHCDLTDADLRQSTFEHCDFSGAIMTRAILARSQESELQLSPIQRKAIDWHLLPGEPPSGG